MPFGDRDFNFGINLAWLNRDFGHDIGQNPYHPDWQVLYDRTRDPDIFDIYFRDIALAGFKVVRLWLFEMLEGLIFDSSSFDPRQMSQPTRYRDYNMPIVEGFDFSGNIERIMELARAHDLEIYWCILSTANVYSNPQAPSNWALTQLINSPHLRAAFWENAFIPFLQIIAPYRANVFAIDLINEPEGLQSHSRTELNAGVRDFIAEGASIIHNDPFEGYNILCSVGFSNRGTLRENAIFLEEHLDFFDYHIYATHSSLDPYRADDYGGMEYCLIGEFGIGRFVRGIMEGLKQCTGEDWYNRDWGVLADVTRAFMNSAISPLNNYKGCFLWRYGPIYANTDCFELLRTRDFNIRTMAGLNAFLRNLRARPRDHWRRNVLEVIESFVAEHRDRLR